MKKIFKGLSILVAATALCGGVAMATACDGGYNGTYTGEYHYIGAHSSTPYGMVVEVKVENNIIVSVKNITNTEAAKSYQTYKSVIDGKEEAEATYHEWTVVSQGWEDFFNTSVIYWGLFTTESDAMKGLTGYKADTQYVRKLDEKGDVVFGEFVEWDGNVPKPIQTSVYSYDWTNTNSATWSDHESWILQQYVGKSVADVLAIDVYTDYGYALYTQDNGQLGQKLDMSSKGEPYATSYNAGLEDSKLLITGATQGSGRLLLAVQDALKNK